MKDFKLESCPVCNASVTNALKCGRCETDFTEFNKIMSISEKYANTAEFFFNKKKYVEAYHLAVKSYSLKKNLKTEKILEICKH